MGLIRHFAEAVKFVGLPREQRCIVFYSEGREYWTHLGDILERTLEQCEGGVCYLTSDPDDPGLQMRHPALRTFVTDRSHFRDWLLNSLETDVCVMTMPDLDRLQVRRSSKTAHYVYAPHSLVSLHMAYRPGAFDHYDTLFCCGPHHIREAQEIERQRGVQPKALIEQGYARLDRMCASIAPGRRPNTRKSVLIAPSWGPQGLVESGGEDIVAALLDQDIDVILRPHPQTTRLRPHRIVSMRSRFGDHPGFKLETEVGGWDTLDNADTMVSDWSGAALEFALARRRPLVFLETPRKVNNPDYERIACEPIEVSIRDDVGVTAGLDDSAGIVSAITRCIESPDLPAKIVDRHVFNSGKAAEVGARYIASLTTSGKA